MTEKIILENAFVLHARPYRETSLLLDFFTQKYGRVSAVARGARKAGNARKSMLQPFRAILVSLSGRSELKNVTDVEVRDISPHLTGNRLLSAMYINELLYKSLPKFDAHAQLFSNYQDLIARLQVPTVEIEPLLRCFEMQLLSDLGYAISLTEEAHGGGQIEPDKRYLFQPGHGFTLTGDAVSGNNFLFLGSHLLSFAKNELIDKSMLKSAKRLMRIALSELLGEKAINSKELFIKTGGVEYGEFN